jgi:DNA-binding transcriptional MerR regulator
MADEPVVIPEKLYFKIGEVCDLVGVQAHVLRYWETEFPMLSPQKNSSGQRSYRRKDVEMALRIKQLLYKEMFTIAGARKKLQAEHREGSKERIATSNRRDSAPTLFDTGFDEPESRTDGPFSPKQRDALRNIAVELVNIRELLKSSQV